MAEHPGEDVIGKANVANVVIFVNFTCFINSVKFSKYGAAYFTLHFHTKQKNHLEYLLLSIK